ncbi:hypothetical protein GPALN_011728 [Globodera pallida]|nr:hypothetical protein GPALN_011728 [Globodera pallida]
MNKCANFSLLSFVSSCNKFEDENAQEFELQKRPTIYTTRPLDSVATNEQHKPRLAHVPAGTFLQLLGRGELVECSEYKAPKSLRAKTAALKWHGAKTAALKWHGAKTAALKWHGAKMARRQNGRAKTA